MANTLTNLIPTLYTAVDIVSREMTGLIPAVAVNAAAEQAAKDESIRVPITPAAQTYDITPGAVPGDNGDQVIDSVEMKITKTKMAPVRWNGEEQKALGNAGTYNAILAQQIAQAMRALVNEVEGDLAGLYVHACRAAGTAGTTPFASSLNDAAAVRKLLADNGSPMTDLQLVLDTAAGAKLRGLANLTRANEAASDQTLRRGVLLDLLGFAVRESAQIKQHTPGAASGALVNNASGYDIGATSIAWDTAESSTLKGGDVVHFGTDTTQYVLASGGATSPLVLGKPGLVKAVPDNAAIGVGSAYAANLAFDRNAIQLLCRAPAMPEGGDAAVGVEYVTDPVSGIAFQVAMYRGYRQIKLEVGLAWGVACIKPQHLAILMG